MRDPNRIDPIIEEIRAIWKSKPDMRLGQLVVNASGQAEPFYIEDDELLEGVREQARFT